MKKNIIIILLIASTFVAGLFLYPKMPDQMASHWNSRNQVDGYMDKFWGVFLMPIAAIGMLLLFSFIPKIDPLRENIEKFRKHFDRFAILAVAFLLYVHFLSISWNLGNEFSMGRMMIPGLGILFYYCGVLVENAKKNWFIGIRTPWTLSNDIVWEKTHKLGGKLFKIAGAAVFLGMFFPENAQIFALIPVLFVAVFIVVYSYAVYRKERCKV